MLPVVKRWVTPPDLGDPDRNRVSRTQHWMLLIGVAASGGLLFSVPFSEGVSHDAVVVYAGALATTVIGFVLLHAGRPRASGLVFSGGMWALGALAEATYGVRSGAVIVHVLTIVLAGFFWSVRGANVVAAASVVWLGVVAYLGSHGLLPEPAEVSPYRMWVSSSLCLVFVAATLRLALQSMTVALSDARRSADEARASREALEQSVEEQRLSELARRRLERQLDEARRLESLGRLAGGVAHDFNNLLTVVLANAGVLRRRGPSPDDEHRLAEIEQAGRRASDLTRQLLAVGGRQVRESRVLSLSDVLRSLEPLLKRVLPENVVLELRLDEGVAPVRADASQLEQVVVNLVANARDAMPDGGRLTLETRPLELSGNERRDEALLAARPGRYSVLEVRDTGRGMDEETRLNIFDPFFTTKGDGTGLGLATVHGVVAQSGGHIWVESEVGRGSRFVVLLPSVQGPCDESSAAAVGSEAPSRALSGTVLLVEDDDSVRDVLARLLRDAGLEVHTASSAQEALAREQDLPRVDLLVTDVVMPGMAGPELARRMRERRSGLPVLLLSGHPGESMHEAPTDPYVTFLHKPFTDDVLLGRVRAALFTDAPLRHAVEIA